MPDSWTVTSSRQRKGIIAFAITQRRQIGKYVYYSRSLKYDHVQYRLQDLNTTAYYFLRRPVIAHCDQRLCIVYLSNLSMNSIAWYGGVSDLLAIGFAMGKCHLCFQIYSFLMMEFMVPRDGCCISNHFITHHFGSGQAKTWMAKCGLTFF